MGPRFLAVDYYLEAGRRAEKNRQSMLIPLAQPPASSTPCEVPRGEQPSQCLLSVSVAHDALKVASALQKLETLIEPPCSGPLPREVTATLVSSFLPER